MILMPDYFLPSAVWLEFEEGYRPRPYFCTAKRLTIGIGRNLQDRGITKQEAELIQLWDQHHKHKAASLTKFHPLAIKIGHEWFIGYGHNLTKYGISRNIAEIMLQNDITDTVDWLERYSWWAGLSVPRKCAIINMGFQLGPRRFQGFKNTIKYLEQGLFSSAARECLDSAWANQTPDRALRVSKTLKNDTLPDHVMKKLEAQA